MISTVTSKNQVTVPAAVADSAGISPGTKLDWEFSETAGLQVRVLPNPAQIASSLRGRGRRFLRPGQDPIADLAREREEEDREREGQ